MSKTTPITRIYLRLPNWVGDVCMALPVVEALTRLYKPQGIETVLCGKGFAQSVLAELVATTPGLRFLTITGKWKADHKTVKADLKAHPTPHPVGLLIPQSLTSALTFRLAGLKCAGYPADGRSLLLKWRLTKRREKEHRVLFWHDIAVQAFAAWGLPAPESPAPTLSLPLPKSAYENARSAIQALADVPAEATEPTPYVLIAPTCTKEARIWPHFEALTQALQARGHRVVMSVPPAEIPLATRNAPSATLLESLSLPAYIALCQNAQVVLCNDSGVAHLAATTTAPQITLFGRSPTWECPPWKPSAQVLGTDHEWASLQTVLQATLALIEKN